MGIAITWTGFPPRVCSANTIMYVRVSNCGVVAKYAGLFFGKIKKTIAFNGRYSLDDVQCSLFGFGQNQTTCFLILKY